MYKQGKYQIVSKKNLAKGIFDVEILCPEIAELAQPGQFAQVAAEGFFLRRPISICDIDKAKGTIRLVFEIRGKGTEKLADLCKGQLIDIIAPLGKGFKVLEGRKIVCVGGGIGVPPMVGIAKAYGENAVAISGFRNMAAVILQDDLQAAGGKAILCTDDGSAGRKGFVTDALTEQIAADKPDIIVACGPMVMLKNVAKIAEANGIECQVSLEQRMACGVGACLVCACRTVRDGKEIHSHVCKDGPVFDSKEVVFE
ncbi:dihydroorotate dehydrogenase electron transfer subunit [Ruminococcus albus]|uniref:Dihydroorotate dehydrogenase B (NAD(+)), electron transfer subunit n=1 Tax=Ruminococcus albus 8 TaxID=246199 RepID=E9SH99_RUMAL|nr:dihydroorotate dehydrogenase electron transfer subunit [Ruminococcus albus]EGC01303.1 putative dihydroorotate oxidase, electron transfer subunit [Ruminococcus albus 8]MCC3351082.1 dihydroorotate dehydrogenase electron transfer subunit [Ruminococcus albus 8]